MKVIPRHVTVQPILNRSRGVWYYEWFAGVADGPWDDPVEATRCDNIMLQTLAANAPVIRAVPVGVNLAFLTAVHAGPQMVKRLAELLPSGSVVELTEHAADQATELELQQVKRTCDALRGAGMILALDDCTPSHPFGDRTLWRMLQPRIIKVDLASVGVEAMAAQAHQEGMLLVCERVETSAREMQAVALQADGMQGFLIAPPRAIEEQSREVSRV